MTLTIAYVTCRWNCKLEWFLDSLKNQISDDAVEIIVVDFHSTDDGRKAGLERQLTERGFTGTVTAPKPTVWQGPYRLTKENWFAASNQRNTALCLCRTPYLAYVDDVSVLCPGWYESVKRAVAGNYIACGSYQKVKQLVVESGNIVSFEHFDGGVDHRIEMVNEDVAPCNGNWMFGCNLVFPVEDLLEVGGWPEWTDGSGSEDTTLGIILRNAGKHLKFCRKMKTLESDELHQYTVGSGTSWDNGSHVSGNMIRRDKGNIGTPDSKSHAIVRMAYGSKYSANYYEGGMRALREHMLNGGQWPTSQIPDRDWYDGSKISEME